MMLSCDLRDRFVDQYLTRMIDLFLAHLSHRHLNQINFSLKYSAFERIHVSHFEFDVIFVMFL